MGISKLKKGNNTKLFSVTIIVPARNEEKNIGNCLHSLLQQTYPKENCSIIVVDDESTDNTAAIVEKNSQEFSNIQLIRIHNRPQNISPKIYAVQTAIQHCNSEIIFTTDADCVANPNWISTSTQHFEENVGVVTGTTIFSNKNKISPLLFGIQFIEFISQTACGAGAIGLRKVNNCNGSNMAFRKKAYEEVDGYNSIAHLNSGDDSLLAQLILQKTQWKIRFALEPEAQVTTNPVETWKHFFQQRMRWASQTTEYEPLTVFFLSSIFFLYVMLCIFSIVAFWYPTLFVPIIFSLCAKFFIDFFILKKFTHRTNTQYIMKYFIPAAIIHIPSILISVLGGFIGTFEWKGRKLQRTT